MLDATASMIQYQAGETVFPIPFPFLENSHIRAHLRTADGATRSLAAGVDYAIAGAELVLLGGALPAGAVLTIRRQLPLTQEIFFHNQGPNSPQAIEEAVDKLTMITQQLQDDIDTAAAEPGESTPDNTPRIDALETALAAKAEKSHSHTMAEIPNLAASFNAKADAAATTQALAGKASLSALAAKADATALSAKADKYELAQKADLPLLDQKADKWALDAKADKTALDAKANLSHRHTMDTVDGLSSALAGKVNVDDPRLVAAEAGPHAAAHASGGSDPLTPAALGVLPAPPANGKTYLASGDGWTEYTPPEPAESDPTIPEHEHEHAHPQSEVEYLTDDLAEIREDVAELSQAESTLAQRMGSTESGLLSVAAGIAAATESAEKWEALLDAMCGLGALARAADAPADDRQYVRRNSAWAAIEFPEGGFPPPGGNPSAPSGGGTFLGDIRLLPFRGDDLPDGWHFCNGAALSLADAAGRALSSLPESYKTDWGVVENYPAGTITLPNLFDAETGLGFFLRGVNGVSRRPGGTQNDAIRNITGKFALHNTGGVVIGNPGTPALRSALEGAFTTQNSFSKAYGTQTAAYGGSSSGDLLFDASLSVPTAAENRPVNVGMTPAVYLGA